MVRGGHGGTPPRRFAGSIANLKSLGIEFKEDKEVDINDRLSGLLNKDFEVGVIYDTDPETTDGRYCRIRWE
jgi:hypothetical protein